MSGKGMAVSERGIFFDEFEKALASGQLTDFGAAVRSLRFCTGLGQRRFAAMVKLPLQRLRDIESNQSELDVVTLNQILFMFGFQTGITRLKRSMNRDPFVPREKYP